MKSSSIWLKMNLSAALLSCIVTIVTPNDDLMGSFFPSDDSELSGILEKYFGEEVSKKLVNTAMEGWKKGAPVESLLSFLEGLDGLETDHLSRGIVSVTQALAERLSQPGAQDQLKMILNMAPLFLSSFSQKPSVERQEQATDGGRIKESKDDNSAKKKLESLMDWDFEDAEDAAESGVKMMEALSSFKLGRIVIKMAEKVAEAALAIAEDESAPEIFAALKDDAERSKISTTKEEKLKGEKSTEKKHLEL